MVALAVKLCGEQGAYRGPAIATYVFIAFGQAGIECRKPRSEQSDSSFLRTQTEVGNNLMGPRQFDAVRLNDIPPQQVLEDRTRSTRPLYAFFTGSAE